MSATLVDGPLAVDLRLLRRGDLPRVGGKAANLGELCAAGFPVPAGFCLTTAAWAQVVEAAGASLLSPLEALARVPAGDDAQGAERLKTLAQAARAAIEGAPLPTAVAEACREAYAALEAECGLGVAVAVRSSATFEDLPDASFAGQQDTLLNVMGAADVMAAVQRCWGSLFTERATAYRQRQRLDHRGVALAVVVQRLVPAGTAGVLFTADPVSGRRDLSVIDASPGLGEAVVSGAVNPDHLEVRSDTLEVERTRRGDGAFALVADAAGGMRREPRQPATECCLGPAQVRALVALGQRVAQHFGAPQDVEWAFGPGGELFLLQARPITTLFPLPRASAFPGDEYPLRVFFNFSIAQGVLRPMTPMGLSAWAHLLSAVQTLLGAPPADREAPPVLSHGAQRLFFDVTPMVRSDLGRRAISFVLSNMEARTARLLEALFTEPRLEAVRVKRRWLLPRVVRLAVLTRVPFRLVHAMLFPAAARRGVEAAGAASWQLASAPVPAEPLAALQMVEGVLARGVPLTFLRVAPVFLAGMLALRVARRRFAGLATPQEFDAVLRALPNNVTTAMDLELAALASRADADPAARLALRGPSTPQDLAEAWRQGALPAVLQAGLSEFLQRWGERGVAEIDVGAVRWREDPAQLLATARSYLEAGPDRRPERQFRRSAEEAEAMARELERRARAAGWFKGRLMRFLLGRVRQLAGLREAPKFYLVRMLGRARAVLLTLGQGLAAAGRLSSPDGVFFFSLTEVASALRGRSLVDLEATRRSDLIRETARRHLPRVLLSDGTEVALPHSAPSAGKLEGTPASAGLVSGVARVVLDPATAMLLPGEILVAPSTDPGWTPLFLSAAGLVMEMGGAMSHGAVVAREYGIPAVVGVAGATERIKTGDRIEVDGTRGVVVLATAIPR